MNHDMEYNPMQVGAEMTMDEANTGQARIQSEMEHP